MTIISRSQLDHPALGASGGASLYSDINNIYLKLGDQSPGRYSEFANVAQSTVSEVEHNLGSRLENINVLIFTGSGATKSQVIDFVAEGYSVAEKAGSEKTIIEITTPSVVGTYNFAVVLTDAALTSEKMHQMLASNPSNPTSAAVLKSFWDSNGRGLLLDNSGAIYTQQTLTPKEIATSGSAVPGFLYKADTSVSGFTHTLPANISDYDVIEYVDLAGSFNSGNLTLARNGNTIDGQSSDYVLKTKNQSVKLIGDSSANNWIVVNSIAAESAATGDVSYFTNGLFESDVTTGVTANAGADVTAETSAPLQGTRSCKVTQNATGTAAVVDFEIVVTDSWPEIAQVVPLVEALVKTDVADADGDWTFAIVNTTDSTNLYGPVDLTGSGEMNLIRASATGALIDGKTYVGRLTHTVTTSSRAAIVDRLRLNPVNGNAIVPSTKWQKKTLSSSTNSSGILTDLTFNNLTIGKTYKVSCYFSGSNSSNSSNETSIILYNNPTSGSNQVGQAFLYRDQSVGGNSRMNGSSTIIFKAVTTTLIFNADITGGLVTILGNNSYAFLEQQELYTETADWT
ncbi:hypothetical protein CMK18_22615 [Candidatus Poribacteria bacterium]|nr:hypothetical protein [Candidatus Poribacteria bacterium]|tara:strand:- start:185 stop:1897 length:1713 start_codon:yes stop_codon:yes gene_type:complete